MQAVTSLGGGDVNAIKVSYPDSNNILGVTVINPTDYVFYLKDTAGNKVLTIGRGKGVSLPIYGNNDLFLVSESAPVQAGGNNAICYVFATSGSVDLKVVNLL